MRLVVVGAGGVGGYFGARLAAAGHDVTFVARGRHLAAIREQGLRVRSPLGDVTVTAPAVATIAEAGDADLVLVAVKLWDTDGIAAQLPAGARVLTLQNGVRGALRERPGALGGICYISAVIDEPGVIAHRNAMQRIVFGEFDGRPSPLTAAFLAACGDAGIDAEVSTDIARVIWEKFVFLVGMSATTTAVRAPIGVVREHPRSRALLHDVFAEVVAVGRAAGIDLAEDFADDRLAFCDSLPADMTASMYHDLTQGNRLELAWLSGAVAALGAELGVPTPRNRTVTDILSPFEMGK